MPFSLLSPLVQAASTVEVIAFTSLLDGYAKIGDINPAGEIFDSLKFRDVVAWTAMIVGYAQNGLISDALALFRSMIREGPKSNEYTLAAVLSIFSSLAYLDHGKQLHAVAIRLEKYHQFQWAIELFEKMLQINLKPDHITYVSVLSACNVGLVEEGKSYFSLMKNVHNIEPTSSHYACMIDLFGRAGLLEEAYDIIKNMPIEPDVVAWGSLLSSCRVHKNVDLAKVAAEKLLLIDPKNSGPYSALANTLSFCGKWEDAAKVRKSMRDRAVNKEQGFGWVQIQNKVHIYGVEDALHPQRDAIYRMISKI
ncbi:hypothetical protein Fmac_013580 [Flemingia macrophylla]|uniref:Pentatricopeptide repeat-containing protein n=1 Tax=Flemingia macrophylla TaxID=520843 RepID=A0ABD1MTJ3_9FABA